MIEDYHNLKEEQQKRLMASWSRFLRLHDLLVKVKEDSVYGYELKAMNQQVKRNIECFPEDFMFQLNQEEIPNDYLKSQFVTLNESGNKRGLHIKKMPYAFAEQGIYMLATVLKGELATKQSIFIMRAFKEID